MLKMSDYESKLPVPIKGDFTKVFVYKEGKVLFTGSVSDYRLVPGFPEDSVIEKAFDEAGYKAYQRTCYDERARFEALLKADLFEFHGVQKNPKAEMCYEKALVLVAQDDETTVIDAFDLLVDLIK